MRNIFSRLVTPALTALAVAACSTTPQEPEMTDQDVSDAMLSFAMMSLSGQGFGIEANCKNDENRRAGFIGYSEESKTYQLVLAEGNTMKGTLIKETETTAESIHRKLNDHCFPNP